MNKLIFTVGIVLTLSIGAFGQGEKHRVSSKGQGNAGVLLDSGTTIEGQLQGALDVQKARSGDQVILKTTRAIKDEGRTVVPKGSKLIGRVTEVQPKTKENNASRIGILFDRLEGRALTSDISASIISVTNAGAAGRINDTADTGLMGSSTNSARGSARTTSGGGLLGGVTNTVGSTLNSGVQTIGNVAGSAGQVVDSTTSSVGRTVNGIHISNSVQGSAQSGTTLATPGKNLKLEKGTMIQLQLNSEVRKQ